MSAFKHASSAHPARTEAKSLYLLLEDVERGDPHWIREDLQAILRHQLQAPLAVDLGGMRGRDAQHIETMASARGLTLRSFGDLLAHEHPPVDLLILTKEFAKRNLVSPESHIPREVARVLYYASIAVARLRCGTSISRLPDADLSSGISWCRERAWIDPDLDGVLAEALPLFEAGGAA